MRITVSIDLQLSKQIWYYQRLMPKIGMNWCKNNLGQFDKSNQI